MLTIGSVRHLTREQRKAVRARQSYQRKRATGTAMCGARRKRDGQPCEARALPNGRCRLHGGLSTGAKTPEGRAKALSCLKQFRPKA